MINNWNIRAKYKYVSEIASTLKRLKWSINRILALSNDFKWNFCSGKLEAIALCKDCYIRNLASTGNYSLSQIKSAVGGQILKNLNRKAF